MSFHSEGSDMSEAVSNGSIVGSWYGGDTDGSQMVFTFLADGTFLLTDNGNPASDPNGTPGLEWGTYTWDAATGAFSADVLINTDGEWGMSHSTITSVTVIDDVFTLTATDGSFSAPRLMSPAGSIIGSWYNAPSDPNGGTDQIVFTFLADGSLLVADKGTVARDPSGTSGIECGTYTWDAATGATVIDIQINTDGQWGFASGAPETINMTLDVSGDTLSILVSDGDGGTAMRLSPLAGITGTTGNDMLNGMGGDDDIDGLAGIDMSLYAGTRSGYTVTKTAAGFTVADNSGAEGTDTLVSIERLHFSNVNVALDLDGNAGNVARILGAVFGAGSISNREFVGIGLSFMDSGMSYEALMQLAINYTLGGTSNHAAVVNLLWANVIGGAPSEANLASYVGMLDGGMSAGALGVLAAGTVFNENNIGLVGLMQTGIEFG